MKRIIFSDEARADLRAIPQHIAMNILTAIHRLAEHSSGPVKELKGFQRVTLQPGEMKTVTLPITPDRLAFWNIDMKYVVEPGEFQIMVGSNSADLKSTTLTVQ